MISKISDRCFSLGEGDEGQLGSGFQVDQLRVWSWLANLTRSLNFFIIFSSIYIHLSFLQDVADIVHRYHLGELSRTLHTMQYPE